MIGATTSERLRLLLPVSVACVCVAVLAVLGGRARAGELFLWDVELHDLLSGYSKPEFNELADDLISLFLRVGVNVVVVAVAVTSAYVLRARGRARALWFVLSSVGCAVVLTLLLKTVFERSPPDPFVKYELPSGHATRSFVAAGILVALTWRTRWRWPATAAAVLFVAAAGTSAVYADWHLPTDVVAGWALALLVLVIARGVFLARPQLAADRTVDTVPGEDRRDS